MRNLLQREKILVFYDECQRGLLPYRFFERWFEKRQIYETDMTSLAPLGSKDNTLKATIEEISDGYIFITGDKDFVKNTANLSSTGLIICFSNNSYTSEKKISTLNRLFKTKGFKFKNIYDLLKRYARIFVNENNVRCLLRKNDSWKVIPLYREYRYNF